MDRYVVVHYHELGLKGRNRPFFEKALLRNLVDRTHDVGVLSGERLSGRLVLSLARDAHWPLVRQRLQTTFGIAYFGLAYRAPLRIDAIRSLVLETLPREGYETFAVQASRANKRFEMSSNQINVDIGAAIQAQTGTPVSLSRPGLGVRIEVLFKEAYVYYERVPGPGGLPVGVSGPVLCLISGGIDSPVAAERMLKRGCDVSFVHFHAAPFQTRTSEVKCIELVRELTSYGASPVMWSVPFGPLQREVTLAAPDRYWVIIYRRLMLRIGEAIARREGMQALVTGESLGQVASQTLTNLGAIGAAVSMPVLRPLVGMDKQEIVAEAKQIGTFEISKVHGEDCCQLFLPANPSTHTSVEEIEQAEAGIDVDDLVRRGVEGAERMDVLRDSGRGESVLSRMLLEG